MKTAYVYVMANGKQTIYVGVTTDLERRVWEHKTHFHDGFTKRYNLTKLVYIEEFAGIDDAIAWEKALKGRTRAKSSRSLKNEIRAGMILPGTGL